MLDGLWWRQVGLLGASCVCFETLWKVAIIAAWDCKQDEICEPDQCQQDDLGEHVIRLSTSEAAYRVPDALWQARRLVWAFQGILRQAVGRWRRRLRRRGYRYGISGSVPAKSRV